MRLHGQVICKTGGLSCWSLSLSLAGLMTQVTLGNCTWEKLRQSLCLPAASSQQETEALCPTNAGHYILPITGHSLEAILPRSSVQIRQSSAAAPSTALQEPWINVLLQETKARSTQVKPLGWWRCCHTAGHRASPGLLRCKSHTKCPQLA